MAALSCGSDSVGPVWCGVGSVSAPSGPTVHLRWDSLRSGISNTSGRNPRRILSALNFIWLVSPLQDQSGTRGVNPLDIDQAQLVQVVEVCVGCEQSEIVDMSDSGNPQIVFAHVPAV